MKIDWTEPGRIDALKALAARGYSASVMAYQLGVTRNVIIGAANRHGVRLEYTGHRTGLSFRADRKIPSKPLVPMAPEPDAKRLPITSLKKNECRYPVTAHSPHLFCGHPKAEGSSYCAHHHHITVAK